MNWNSPVTLWPRPGCPDHVIPNPPIKIRMLILCVCAAVIAGKLFLELSGNGYAPIVDPIAYAGCEKPKSDVF